MFEKRRKIKEGIIEKKDKDVLINDSAEVSPYDKMADDSKNIIRPIVFFEPGDNITNKGLVDFPFHFMTLSNGTIAENISTSLDPIKNLGKSGKGYIYEFDTGNRDILTRNIYNYIVQNTVTTIQSALISSNLSNVYAYIPIAQYIQESFDQTLDNRYYYNHLYKFIEELVYSKDGVSSVNLSNEQFEITTALITNYISLIDNVLVSTIYFATDRAITDVLMSNVTPNINSIYNMIQENGNLDIKQNIPLICTTYLKEKTRELFDVVLKSSIFVMVNSIISSIAVTLFYVYDDYMYYDFDPSIKDRIESTNCNKHNCNDCGNSDGCEIIHF